MWSQGAFGARLCFTMKEPRSRHTLLPSCDTDAHLPSCSSGPYEFQPLDFSSWHNISLSDASDGNCTELPRSAGNQFFTPPNSSPKFTMRNQALALSYLMSYFFLLFLLYITFWQMQVEVFQDKQRYLCRTLRHPMATHYFSIKFTVHWQLLCFNFLPFVYWRTKCITQSPIKVRLS